MKIRFYRYKNVKMAKICVYDRCIRDMSSIHMTDECQSLSHVFQCVRVCVCVFTVLTTVGSRALSFSDHYCQSTCHNVILSVICPQLVLLFWSADFHKNCYVGYMTMYMYGILKIS